jgi:hypothetical protein
VARREIANLFYVRSNRISVFICRYSIILVHLFCNQKARESYLLPAPFSEEVVISNYNKRKSAQLGMNASTANHRLKVDILWNLVEKTEQDLCFHCGLVMTRETFSIEHKVPWLHEPNAFELFFDLDNISFSHLKCNVGAARRYEDKYSSRQPMTEAEKKTDKKRRDNWTPEQRAKNNAQMKAWRDRQKK